MDCKICKKNAKEKFKEFGYEILEDYINNSTPIYGIDDCGYEVMCTWCTIKNGGRPSRFHSSNPYTINNIQKFLVENNSDYTIKENQTYISNSSDLIFTCNYCGEFPSTLAKIQSGSGCPYCSGHAVKIGLNDIATTRNDLVKYFKNKTDANEYTQWSDKYCDFICPDCGLEKNMRISNLTHRGFTCGRCSDGVSMPNKFLANFLSEAGCYFELEKVFNGKKYKYDAYVILNDTEYTIEVHGMQHYEKFRYKNHKRTLEEEKANDKNKRNFSESLGNTHIEVDCRYSKFDFLKEQFISALGCIFDLSNIDWEKVYKKSERSLLLEACKIMKDSDNTMTAIEVGDKIGVSNVTAIKYLKTGTDLNLCNYDYDKIRKLACIKIGKKKSRKVYQFSSDGIFIREYPSVKVAKDDTGLSNISACCRNENKYMFIGGYLWSYTNDIDKVKERLCEIHKLNREYVNTRSRKVNQFSLDGDFVAQYISTSKAKEITK